MRKFVVALVIGAFVAGVAQAALVNGSFESPTVTHYTNGAEADGWVYERIGTGYRDMDIWTSHPGMSSPDGGVQLINIRSYTIWQNTGIQITEGTTYTLGLYAACDLGKTDNFFFQVLKNADVAATGIGTLLRTSWNTAPLITTNSLQEFSLSYTATADDAGQYLQVLISSPNSVNDYVYFDAVTLTSVPEPATMSLLTIGSLLLMRKRK